MLHTSLHPVDAGQGHTDQRRSRYAPMNPGAFCHPLRRGRVGIVSPREPYLAALTTTRRLISGCGSETLSRLSGFLWFSYEISLRPPWGSSAPAGAGAYHRVCACPPTAGRTRSYTSNLSRSCIWVCSTCYGYLLESWPLLGSGLSSPARWDPPVSSRAIADLSGASPRVRWESTCRVCRQHSQLSALLPARAVPMEWERHAQTAPGQHPFASTGGRQ